MTTTIFRIPGLSRHGCTLPDSGEFDLGCVTKCNCGRYYRNEADPSLHYIGLDRRPRWRRVYRLRFSWPLRRKPQGMHWDRSKAKVMARAGSVGGGAMALHLALTEEAGLVPVLTTERDGYALTADKVEWLVEQLQASVRAIADKQRAASDRVARKDAS